MSTNGRPVMIQDDSTAIFHDYLQFCDDRSDYELVNHPSCQVLVVHGNLNVVLPSSENN